MAHRRNMRRATARRSKERQVMHDLKDAQYAADCKGISGSSSLFASVASACTDMFSSLGGMVWVGNTRVPRGRPVREEEWQELSGKRQLRYDEAVKVLLVPTSDEINEAAEGGVDSLFFSNDETMNIRRELSSGQPMEEFHQMMSDMRLDAARQRRAWLSHQAKARGEGRKALGVRERGAEIVPSLC